MFYCDILPFGDPLLPQIPSLPPPPSPQSPLTRAKLHKKLDPSHAALLKVRPLDPYSSQRLNDIRSSFVKTEQSINEVSSQLDAQIEKKYEEKKQAGRWVAACQCHLR